MFEILICGDLYSSGKNEQYFCEGNRNGLLNNLESVFSQAELIIANLECPLINFKDPILKSGPNLGAPEATVKGIKALGIEALNLANNHIMDHGSQGLENTIRLLRVNNISHFGAGSDLADAQKILIKEVNNDRIAFLGIAEHEFCIAKENKPGANSIDLINTIRNINSCRQEFDYLVILIHGGSEYYEYPRPSMVKLSRFLVEQGAKAVVWQHSHCVGCVEVYQDAPIVYGQGNFIFDYPSNSELWHTGMIVALTPTKQGVFAHRLIPFTQSFQGCGVNRMTEVEEREFFANLHRRSLTIHDEEQLEWIWKDYCKHRKSYCINGLYGKKSILRRLAGKLGLLHLLGSKEANLTRLHFVRCESLREITITALENDLE